MKLNKEFRVKKMIVMAMSFWMAQASFSHEVVIKVTLSPAGSFEAKSAKLTGVVKKAGDKFTSEQLFVVVKDLKTGISLRDEHFQNYLTVDKSPRVVLAKVVAGGGKGTGILIIGNKKKAQEFTYKALGPKKLEATFKVKAQAFGLKKMEYMGVEVEDEVEVVATIDI